MKQIFVYGSLRKGMYNYEQYLLNHSTFLAYGYVKGSLYALHHVSYPALLEGNDFILGEIYEVSDQVALQLDALEEYVQGDPNNTYNKILSDIYVKDCAQTITLPVYFFNMKKQEHLSMLKHKIEEHDYVQYYQKKTS